MVEDLMLDELRGERGVEVVIDDYGYQGEGYVRLRDGFLSVPGALPGEAVRVDVPEGHPDSNRVWAMLVEVSERSSQRRDPLCEVDDVCRGCQLRHMTTGEELRFHVRTVSEVIEKYAGLTVDDRPDVDIVTPEPISRGDGFRIRTRLTYRRTSEGCELGLVSPVRDELVGMDECPALITPVRRLVSTVTGCFDAADDIPLAGGGDDAEPATEPRLEAVRVVSPVYGRGMIDLRLSGDVSEGELEEEAGGPAFGPLLDRLHNSVADEVGISIGSGDIRRLVKPPERIQLPIAGLRLNVGFDDWMPATLEPTNAVYDKLMELVGLSGDDQFLDVGCGIGTISLLASRRARNVVGLDGNRRSIGTAELNAVEEEAENVEFRVGGWETALRKLTLEGDAFDVGTINPMREPLGRRPLSYLGELGLERLVYLGPSPESAAKDISELLDLGWTIDYLAAANIHPATYHTMMIARLRRS